MVWIITKSAHYYPAEGVSDWRLVTANEEEANSAWDALETGKYEIAYLVRIDADGSYAIIGAK